MALWHCYCNQSPWSVLKKWWSNLFLRYIYMSMCGPVYVYDMQIIILSATSKLTMDNAYVNWQYTKEYKNKNSFPALFLLWHLLFDSMILGSLKLVSSPSVLSSCSFPTLKNSGQDFNSPHIRLLHFFPMPSVFCAICPTNTLQSRCTWVPEQR